MSGNRIKELREAAGLTLEGLAERVDLSTSYVQRLENGERNLATKHLDNFANALGVTPRDLIEKADSETSIVRVMGRIGAGAEILPEAEQLPPEGLFEIEVPFPVPEHTVAFEVMGDSMWPRYDAGDVILCWRQGTNAHEIVGWEAAVQTHEGKRYLKRIVLGSRVRHYDLESYNAPAIRNVKLDWVSKVQFVVRAGEWKQISVKAQKRAAKKMAAAR